MPYTPQLVLLVNEIFHDLEGEDYDRRHPEILAAEVRRWEAVARRFIAGQPFPVTLLDIGSGTGFVPLSCAPLLSAGDRVICADLSARMLDVCRRNLLARAFACDFQFHKLQGSSLGLPDGCANVVTINSVLHHVPELEAFLREVDRVLAAGGRLVIGHEPHRPFFARRLLRWNSQLAALALAPGVALAAALYRTGLMGPALRFLAPFSRALRTQRDLVAEVNRRLIAAGAVSRPLGAGEIVAIVDIHSPTAGGYHPQRGIEIGSLARQFLPGYRRLHFETYNHLGKVPVERGLARRYAQWLARRHPDLGSQFLAVLEKPGPD